MPAPIIVSRVRATLHKQGYQGFSLEQIIEAANTLNIDINNPSPEDTKAVATHLMEISPITKLQGSTTEQSESSAELIQQHMLDSLPSFGVGSAITASQKTEMVANQAQLMGITLADSDIQNIAQQVDFQATDSNELIDEIKSFLVAFINYRESQNQSKLNQAFNEIIHHANASNQRVSDSLHTGLTALATQMESQRYHFKSSVRSALKHLTIPSSEA